LLPVPFRPELGLQGRNAPTGLASAEGTGERRLLIAELGLDMTVLLI